jgi:hypothetical protein
MQKPSIKVDAIYRRVCVEQVSNVIGIKGNWIDSVIYVQDAPHNLNRYKIAIHIVYLSNHSMI